jgi:ubiquinone biosynthesis protein Coq4
MNPNRTDLIFKVVDIASHDTGNPVVAELEGKMMEEPVVRDMYEKHYVPDVPQMAMLAKCPEQSFGNLLYHHLADNNLDLSLWPRFEYKRPVDYISLRIYQDHDLWHVLLGATVSVEDELKVQAFGVAQYQSPISTLLVAGGLLHLLMKDPMRAVKAMSQVAEGFNLGKKAKFMLTVKLHEMFALPIGEVRQACLLPA